jgi:hypothetical protein
LSASAPCSRRLDDVDRGASIDLRGAAGRSGGRRLPAVRPVGVRRSAKDGTHAMSLGAHTRALNPVNRSRPRPMR